MSNATYQFRVVIHIMPDNIWEDQEVITGEVWDDMPAAIAERDGLDLTRYSEGTYAYVEERMFSDWEVSDA